MAGPAPTEHIGSPHSMRALVTGAARGIGRAVALSLARAGADVVVNYRSSRREAEEAVSEIRRLGRRAEALAADVADPAGARRLVADAVRALGGLDIVVNNAGVLTRSPFLELTVEDFDRVMGTNARSVFLVGQAAARHMVEAGAGGVIINVSSVVAYRTSPNLAHYGASKAAVSALTRHMARELAPYGIRVNEVNPGLTLTDMNRADFADPAFVEQRVRSIPLGRVGTPDDVAAAVVYLASPAARQVTGTCLFVDGGVYAV